MTCCSCQSFLLKKKRLLLSLLLKNLTPYLIFHLHQVFLLRLWACQLLSQLLTFANTLASICDVLPHLTPLANFYSFSKTIQISISCWKTEFVALYPVFPRHISTVAPFHSNLFLHICLSPRLRTWSWNCTFLIFVFLEQRLAQSRSSISIFTYFHSHKKLVFNGELMSYRQRFWSMEVTRILLSKSHINSHSYSWFFSLQVTLLLTRNKSLGCLVMLRYSTMSGFWAGFPAIVLFPLWLLDSTPAISLSRKMPQTWWFLSTDLWNDEQCGTSVII